MFRCGGVTEFADVTDRNRVGLSTSDRPQRWPRICTLPIRARRRRCGGSFFGDCRLRGRVRGVLVAAPSPAACSLPPSSAPTPSSHLCSPVLRPLPAPDCLAPSRRLSYKPQPAPPQGQPHWPVIYTPWARAHTIADTCAAGGIWAGTRCTPSDHRQAVRGMPPL